MDANVPPFFRSLSLFFPPDQIGMSTLFLLISRILGTVPFSLFHSESLRLPGFSRLHSSPCISILVRRRFAASLPGLLFSLSTLYFLLSTLPTLLVTVEYVFASMHCYLAASCMVMLWLIG